MDHFSSYINVARNQSKWCDCALKALFPTTYWFKLSSLPDPTKNFLSSGCLNPVEMTFFVVSILLAVASFLILFDWRRIYILLSNSIFKSCYHTKIGISHKYFFQWSSYVIGGFGMGFLGILRNGYFYFRLDHKIPGDQGSPNNPKLKIFQPVGKSRLRWNCWTEISDFPACIFWFCLICKSKSCRAPSAPRRSCIDLFKS